MACRGSFLSSHEENDRDPRSGRDLDPYKPVCLMSCLEDVRDPAFLHAFATDPGVVELVTGSVPVEHHIKVLNSHGIPYEIQKYQALPKRQIMHAEFK